MAKSLIIEPLLKKEDLARKCRPKKEAIIRSKGNSKSGRRPLLNKRQLRRLKKVLKNPPVDGGNWTSRKVANYMSQLSGQHVSIQKGWFYLKNNLNS